MWGCLVCVFKQLCSVFKQHFTHFNALFHPYVFPQMFSNNNFQFLNTYTKRALYGWKSVEMRVILFKNWKHVFKMMYQTAPLSPKHLCFLVRWSLAIYLFSVQHTNASLIFLFVDIAWTLSPMFDWAYFMASKFWLKVNFV